MPDGKLAAVDVEGDAHIQLGEAVEADPPLGDERTWTAKLELDAVARELTML